MKNIVAIIILSFALVACKSTDSVTSSSTEVQDKSALKNTDSFKNVEIKELKKVDDKQEIKTNLMATPIDKNQVKTISTKKLGQD